MTKDRLSALQEGSIYRKVSSADGETIPNSKCTQDADDNKLLIISECQYLSDFLAEVEKVREDISWLKEMVENVKKNHSIMLSVPLIDEGLKRKGDELSSSMRGKSIKIKGKLKDFEIEMERAKKKNPTSAKMRIRQLQFETLSRMFVDVMTEYNSAQAHYKEKCKEKLKRQLEIHGNPMSDEHLDEILEQGNSPTFAVFDIKTELLEAKTVLADVEARHRDILKLEKSIIELHSIFMDMAFQVDRQGDMIDQIAYKVLHTIEFVETATQETRKALVHKN